MYRLFINKVLVVCGFSQSLNFIFIRAALNTEGCQLAVFQTVFGFANNTVNSQFILKC